MTEALAPFVPQETCLSCDGCCRFSDQNSSWRPKMSWEEISDDSPDAGMLSEVLDENGFIRADEYQDQARCVFLRTENNKCDVYEHRPFECRLYPFLLIKNKSNSAVGVHLSCPYVQEKRQESVFEDHVKVLKGYFQQEEILEFLLRNQGLLGNYSGYEQEIECLFELPL